MKTLTHRKLVISSLALLAGATLVTSVTSTVAWFQYSTQAQVAYTGTSAHCSKLLEISVDDGAHWGSVIETADLPTVKFAPISTGEQVKDAPILMKEKTVIIGYEDDNMTPITEDVSSLFYDQPDYRQGLYDNWNLASESSYLQFDVLVRVKDVDDNFDTNPEYLANDVYLTDLTIQDANNLVNLDLSNAVRVQFSTEYKDAGETKNKNFLFAKESTETEVGGFLDMNNDGKLDMSGYEWEKHPTVYGGGTVIPVTEIDPDTGDEVIVDYDIDPLMQTSYAANDYSIIAREDHNQLIGGTSLGSTGNTEGDYLKVTVTIWLEGWAGLMIGNAGNHNEQDTSIWDSDSYAEKNFNVGMTFGVKLHNSEE